MSHFDQLPGLTGIILSGRATHHDPEKGWIEYGPWISGGLFDEDKFRVIQEGTDQEDDWIITEGGGYHFAAEVAMTCVVCGNDITPETGTPRGTHSDFACSPY